MEISNEQIFERMKQIMFELFEVSPESVSLDSRLKDDLGLDSIDAIDLITYLQNLVGHRLQPEEFKSVRTVSDLVVAARATLCQADQKFKADENSQNA